VLVEKPLAAEREDDILELEARARRAGVVCYTAYNHRFEPHYVRMRDLIASNDLGRIYSCRMFYGNGTARLVRDSAWRDQGAGVLPDLGSHLLDTCRFWFGDIDEDFRVISARSFENRAPDHVVVAGAAGALRIELEMTLLMWRNDFSCDILAENGTAHIRSLCKWGPSTFTHRRRVLPSGRPPETSVTLVQDDPTWALEYAHFKELCHKGTPTSLANDLWLNRALRRLGSDAIRLAGEAA
jgi:predicted dehydrogenase